MGLKRALWLKELPLLQVRACHVGGWSGVVGVCADLRCCCVEEDQALLGGVWN